ncbi:molybdopterin-dependent oxidoreductase [Patescibacteria group bacterium]|nr:molybdopterin-dependent oxidoreductase [Patescibacteria group bacterium]
MKRGKQKHLSIFIILIVIFGVVLTYFLTRDNDLKEVNSVQIIEIRNYEGKDLSSVYDFRENSIKGPQYVDLDGYRLQIAGLVDDPVEFLYDEIVNNYEPEKKVVTLNCVEGWSATILWEGIRLKDLFSGIKIKPEANTIIFYAADGYSTSFPIEYIMDNNIIIAYKMNDAFLLPERGFPFQLVAESKWGYKWIKWIERIEFSDNPDYRGFWEKRGYSNSGDLNKSFFD